MGGGLILVKVTMSRFPVLILYCLLPLLALADSANDSVKALREKAEAGDRVSQYELYLKYSLGEVVKRDVVEALKWNKKSAEQGHVMAKRSFIRVKDAAKFGAPRGMYEFGLMHCLGAGVPVDFVEGVAWLLLSSANGDEDDFEEAKKHIESFQKKMTPEQVQRSRARMGELRKEIDAKKGSK